MMKILKYLVAKPLWWLFKLLLKSAAFVAVAVLLLLAAGNFWIPKVIETEIGRRSGFPTKIEKSCGSVFRGRIDFKNFAIKNPYPEFQHKEFIKFNHLVGDIDMTTLTKDTVIVEELTLDLGKISIVKNEDGKTNFMYFADNLQKSIKSPTQKSQLKADKITEQSDKMSKSVIVQKLTLSIGSVTFIDEQDNTSKTYELNYHREFTDLKDFKTLTRALIFDLQKYGLSIIVDSIISTVANLPNIAVDGAIRVKDVSVDVVNKVGETAGKAGKSIKDAVGTGIKKLFEK